MTGIPPTRPARRVRRPVAPGWPALGPAAATRGVALIAMVLACSGAMAKEGEAVPPDDLAVVPYRPSVATPADLPAPGWPELEAGWAGTRGGDTARSQSVPVLFKVAWSERWGALLGTDVHDWQRDPDGATAHSGGDTTLTLKYRLPLGEDVALGAQAGVVVPTARPPIGAGHTGWNLLAIASFDHDDTHVDVNGGASRLGGANDGAGPWRGLWAVSVSHPLAHSFGINGEVSGVAQRGTAPQNQALVALTYNVSRKRVLDVAVAAGLTRAAPDWQVLAGLTVQLGHWF